MTDRIPTFRPRPLTRVPFPLPGKRVREKSGILREPKRIWLKHRRFVRGHQCCVPGCTATEVQFAHIRTAANAGTGLKPHDQFGVPLCFNHHCEQHDCGQGSFEDRHGIDLSAIAAELVRRSTDTQMRLSLLLQDIPERGRGVIEGKSASPLTQQGAATPGDPQGRLPATLQSRTVITDRRPVFTGSAQEAIPIVHFVPFAGRVG